MRRLALLIALLAPVPVLADDCGSLTELRVLLGEWIAVEGRSTFHESWTESTPRTFEGAGTERSNPDDALIGSEELRLVEMAGSVYYLSKVAHNALPIAFVSYSSAPNRKRTESSSLPASLT